MPINTHLAEQPVDFAVPNWKPAVMPTRHVLTGRFCILEPLNSKLETDLRGFMRLVVSH